VCFFVDYVLAKLFLPPGSVKILRRNSDETGKDKRWRKNAALLTVDSFSV
jgi:hypothetical protein